MLVPLRARLLLVASLTVLGVVAPEIGPAVATDLTEKRFHRLINRTRANRGLVRLKLNERLSNTAREHSREMAAGGTTYHHSCLSCAITSYRWRIAGENVGVGETVRQIHRKMMRSRAHRRNILRRGYRRVGIGVARSGGALYVTQIFLG